MTTRLGIPGYVQAKQNAAQRTPEHLALMGHVIADYPTPGDARAMIAAMVGVGVKIIEIQIPFSEPVADGPVFLAANHRALARGVNYDMSLALMQEMTSLYPTTQFVFMSYLNPLFSRGYERFVREAKQAGAIGVIVPDLPLEHAGEFDEICTRQSFYNISLIPPNCPDPRLEMLCSKAKGFVYAVARAGVTGAQTDFGGGLKQFIDRIRLRTSLPVVVGFGVRSAADVTALRGIADYAVVGTRSLLVFEEQGIEGFTRFWGDLAEAVR